MQSNVVVEDGLKVIEKKCNSWELILKYKAIIILIGINMIFDYNGDDDFGIMSMETP